eukprot:scaffold22086_cov28-Tisochrysis_lutea.AAC.2
MASDSASSAATAQRASSTPLCRLASKSARDMPPSPAATRLSRALLATAPAVVTAVRRACCRWG